MKKIIFLSWLIPMLVFASEEDTECKLTKAQVEVNASMLASPAAQVEGGQDPITGTKSINVGVSQSLQGYMRADVLRKAADAKCESIKATTQLDHLQSFRLLQIQQNGAQEEYRDLNDAIERRDELVKLLERQVEARVATLPQLIQARNDVEALRSRQSELDTIMAQELPKLNLISIRQAVLQAREGEVESAHLVAKSSAMQAWDIIAFGGMRQPQVGAASPVFTITAKYSFGGGKASRAADDVGTLTGELFDQKTTGYSNVFSRMKTEVSRRIAIEIELRNNLRDSISLLEDSIKKIEGIDGAPANLFREQMNVQLLAKKAAMDGATVRYIGYQRLLDEMN